MEENNKAHILPINSTAFNKAPHISTYFGSDVSLILQPLTQADLDDLDYEPSEDLITLEKSKKSITKIEPLAKRRATEFMLCKITKTKRNFPIFWFRNLETDHIVAMKKDNFTKTYISLKCENSSGDAVIKNKG